MIETDHNAYTEGTKQSRKLQMAEEMKEVILIEFFREINFFLVKFFREINYFKIIFQAAGEDEQELANEMAEVFLNENLPEEIFGAPKAGAGMWASCIRVMDPIQVHSGGPENLKKVQAKKTHEIK